jgi:hypothetical protein
MEYEFTLKYRLAAADSDDDELVERLGAAGCDDALVGIGQPGRIALDFSREARSAQVGVSRQNMRQLSLAHAESFPTPFHSGTVELWHLAHVLEWLKERGTYRIEQSLLDVARVAMQINLVKESTLIQGEVRREVRNLVA